LGIFPERFHFEAEETNGLKDQMVRSNSAFLGIGPITDVHLNDFRDSDSQQKNLQFFKEERVGKRESVAGCERRQFGRGLNWAGAVVLERMWSMAAVGCWNPRDGKKPRVWGRRKRPDGGEPGGNGGLFRARPAGASGLDFAQELLV
jgi:hypothetical protein